ncbi:hypothetical protein LJK88_38265 [Paenibacillus sp. P26]|nr:hypothetical protein LJK88_38265 [Paenibacillus sp. P26]
MNKMPGIEKLLKDLEKTQVLIGIPEGPANNRPEGSITNAQLLYIHTHGVRQKEMREEMQPEIDKGTPYSKAYEMYLHEHGSPLWHSPPRPVLEPAVNHHKKQIAEKMKGITAEALDGRDPAPAITRLGLYGQNIARDWFTNPNNHWAPNSPVTAELKGDDRPLIDQGELRKSITYVVKKG